MHKPATITSPDEDGDGEYDTGVECLWIIVARVRHLINFEFDYMDLEQYYDCAYDFIEVQSDVAQMTQMSRPQG